MNHSRTHSVLLGTSCLFTALLTSVVARAGGLPTGGNVVAGSATITSPTSTSTIINQSTDKVILTWQDFSIASGSSVTFNQPGSSSIALNRVIGTTPSSINGDLFANGHVWLINGNGILFGKDSVVNVGSLIATTADMNDQDFLNGNYRFGSASNNPNAGIFNNGSITANNGGSIILAGPVVSNNGIIQADMGSVTLGGVSTFSVDFQGDNLLRFAVGTPVQQTPVDADGHPVKALVSNSGTVRARGGRVLMTTRAAESVVDNVINNTGMVEATSVSVKNGEVVLDAGDGTVELGGTVDASGRDAGETGGNVTVEAKKIVVADGARIDVSGDAGGGTVHIGGDRHGDGPTANAQQTVVGDAMITADAITTGNGGEVVVWADDQTVFGGSISAEGGALGGDGGFVETSAKHLTVTQAAEVSTLAPKGKTGTWLLDPENIVIASNGETTLHDGSLDLGDDPGSTDYIDPSTIVTALSSTNVTLEASNDIVVVDDLVYSSTHALSMLAEHNIDVLANVQNTLASGGGNINLIAGWDGTTGVDDITTTPGSYGNNFGNVVVGGNVDPSVGAASGRTLVAGDRVIVDASNGVNAQIGYHGAGGGDILVLAETLALVGGQGSVAQIGNGSFGDDVDGDITGNIDVRIADQSFFVSGSQGGMPWIGNASGTGGTLSGDTRVITGNFNADDGGLGLLQMIFADVGYGNVTLGETGDSISIPTNLVYNSPHDLTLLSTGDIQISGLVQNQGSGSVTAVAGWDGTTLDPSHFGDEGVYGNDGGSFALVGGEGGNDSAFGTRSGTTTVLADDVDLFNSDGFAQIGYHGDGSGAITVNAVGDVNVYGGNTAHAFALIGNGSLLGDVTSDVSGEINVTAGGLTTFAYGGSQSTGGLAWLGNFTEGDGKATGDVTLVTGQVTSFGTNDQGVDPNTLADIMVADLGTSHDTGGNFTLAISNPDTDFLDRMIGGDGGISYHSPHDLSILSSGNLTIANSIQNSGSGALTILAGWNPDVAPCDALTAPGGYGNNGGFVWIVGATGSLADYNPNAEGDHFVDSGEGTAVGSKAGVTTVGGAQIYVEGLSGYAQIGYHGNNGSGAIYVIANGTPGDGGLTGVDACFDGNANICVIGGRDGWGGDDTVAYAQIGDLGMGVEGTSTADIHVSATGNIAVTGGGIYSNGEDPGVANAYGMIGNGDASGTTTQNVSGNIDVRAGGQINFASSSAANSLAWLGNKTSDEGTHAGNVTVIGDKIDGDDFGGMIGYDLGTSSESGGDVLVGFTGQSGVKIDDNNAYSSPHRLSILSAGDITVEGTLENGGSGAIDLIAGWDGTTLAPGHFTDEGVYGNHHGGVFVGGEGASSLAGVGSHGGPLTVAGDDVVVSAVNGIAQLGFASSGGGNIRVYALDDVDLVANVPGTRALIGNGTIGSESTRGDISIVAGGDVSLTAFADSSLAIIGNTSAGGTETGDISIDADGALSLTANGDTSRAVVGNFSFGQGGAESGDIMVNAGSLSLTADNTNARAEIGGGRSNATASGDIDVTAGDMIFNSSGDGSFARIGGGGLNDRTGDITVDSSGSIELTAANNGNAIIGFGAGGTIQGNVTVAADGQIVLTSGDPSQARIGDAATGDVTGNLSVTAGGDIRLLANDDQATATIGSQGANVTTDIAVQSLDGIIDLEANGTESLARIGNNGGESVTGSIDVQALGGEGAIFVTADADGAYALIGNQSYGEAVPITGDISVSSSGMVAVSANGPGTNAIIGNIGGDTSGDINVSTDSLLSLIGGAGGSAVIGSQSTGLVEGNITVAGGEGVVIGAADPSSRAGVGHLANGPVTGDIDVSSAGGSVVLSAQDSDAVAFIGSTATGEDLESSTGDIRVSAAASVSLSALDGARTTVGNSSTAPVEGDITVSGEEGVFLYASGPSGVAGIGNSSDEATDGDLSVSADHGDVHLTASGGATAAIGSSSDRVTGDIGVSAAGEIALSASDQFSVARIGQAGNGAVSGDIDVSGDVTSLSASGGASALIGDSAQGTIDGNITILGGEGVVFSASDTSSLVRVGHAAGGDIAGAIDVVSANGGVELSAADNGSAIVGSSAGNGSVTGNIVVQGAGDVGLDSQDSFVGIGHYAGGDISGNIALTAGGTASLNASGTGASAVVESYGGSVTGDIAVTGSDGVTLAAIGEEAAALIGNHGSSLSGSITVNSDGVIDISSGPGGATGIGGTGGTAAGDISVAGSEVILAAFDDSANARIGNAMQGAVDGDITVAGNDGVSLRSEGASQAEIGNRSFGVVNGDISVSSQQGDVTLSGIFGGTVFVGSRAGAATTGDIDIAAGSGVTFDSRNGTVRVGHLANGDVTGDIDVTATGDVSLDAALQSSEALIGSMAVNGTLTGDITVQSLQGSVNLTAGIHSWAQVGGLSSNTVNGNVTVLANDAENGNITVSASGNGALAEIGNGGFPNEAAPTTSGTIDVETANTLLIEASANDAYAQVGHHANGGGDITVRAGDLQILGGEGNTGTAQLGNGSLNHDLSGDDVVGDLDVRVANLTFLSGTDGGRARIGNANGAGGFSGDVLLISGRVDDNGSQLHNSIISDLDGGDLTIGLTDASHASETDQDFLFDSDHALNILVAGDFTVGGSVQNAGSGDINIVTGWDGHTLDPAHFADSGVYGNGGHGLTIGGNDAVGNAAVGSREGDTTVLGAFLTISGIHGYAQLGYHGGGSGNLSVNVLGDVVLTGGGSTGYYAQIGNGGYQTHGSNSGDIDVEAGGDVVMTGGAGADAYVQVGHGGAESNANATQYANAGMITVTGQNVTVAAGSGNAAYAQIGNGGYLVGSGLTGNSDNSGDITVTVAHAVALTGNGTDAYAQIGNGGNQLNTNAGGSATGTISGNIVVQAEDPDDGSVTMTAGGGTHSYVMIGNGGYSINAPTTAPASNFTISGNILVSDLALTGGDGDYGYAQIGNGDGGHAGTGNVSGDITIESGDITLTNGSGQHSGAMIHNAIGNGNVEGNVEGFEDGGDVNQNPETQGTIVVLTDNSPPPVPPKTDPLPDVLLTGEDGLVSPPTDDGENPIEKMAGGDGDEKASDAAANEVGNSLNGNNKPNGVILLGGILKQQGTGGQTTKPHSVPAADEDYSSWGNEALWQ